MLSDEFIGWKNRKRIVGLVTLYLLGATLSLNTTAQAQSGLGKIYGVAFIDANGNGRRDAGEPTTLGRYKITSVGGYWTCGHTGSDDTYGVTVRPGSVSYDADRWSRSAHLGAGHSC